MRPQSDIERILRTAELRTDLLRYSREAYAQLPAFDRPRVLDIGCGSGLTSIELARLGGGQIVGIDLDESAIGELRERIRNAGLPDRVRAVQASLHDAGFPDESFDLLWEEGVLHLLDPARSFRVCHRLLSPAGRLVMNETVTWFEGIRGRLASFGLAVAGQALLPKHAWWTDYYAPLEARLCELRLEHAEVADSAVLARHEREVAMVKADPGRFDCGFFIIKKAGCAQHG